MRSAIARLTGQTIALDSGRDEPILELELRDDACNSKLTLSEFLDMLIRYKID